MKRTIPVIALYALIFLLPTHIKAQDIVYFKNGEVAGGLVTWQDVTFIRFKNSSTKTGERIEARDIDHYYIAKGKNLYFSKPVPKEFREFESIPVDWFVKQEVGGKICVYSRSLRSQGTGVGQGAGKVTYHFVEKDKSGLQPLNFELLTRKEDKDASQEIVRGFMADNPELAAAFMKEKGSVKNVIRFAEQYNEWFKSQGGKSLGQSPN